MASENETVAEIVRERKHLIEHWMWKPAIRNELRLLDRIEAAHGREIETMRIAACSAQARFDEELAAKNAEVAELRECLKEAVFVMQTLFDKQMPKWRKALKGAKYE